MIWFDTLDVLKNSHCSGQGGSDGAELLPLGTSLWSDIPHTIGLHTVNVAGGPTESIESVREANLAFQ